jgi:hypothetical protein
METIMSKPVLTSRLLICGVLTLCASALACSSAPQESEMPTEGPLANAPPWVVKGGHAYWGDESDGHISGVGSAEGTRNKALARTMAIGRARTEISRSLATKVTAMLKDYQSTTTGGAEFGESANDEQHIEDVSKQITETTLSGTTPMDTWWSPDGTIYVLVAMDYENFSEAVAKMNQLSEGVRKAVQERAEEAFTELDEATAG